MPCPVCGNESTEIGSSVGRERRKLDCVRCGKFEYTRTAEPQIQNNKEAGPRNVAILSHAIRRMHERSEWPILDSNSTRAILQSNNLPALREQADIFLIWVGDKTHDAPATPYAIRQEAVVGIMGAIEWGGALYVREYLQSSGLIQEDHGTFRLTFTGWDRYYVLKHTYAGGKSAFMAMPFDKALISESVFAAFKSAVAQTDFDLRRNIDGQPAGLIDNHLVTQIRQARFAIVDLTGNNSGAYWEAGLAEGLGRPVIYSCRSEWFHHTDYRKRPHFDTNHHVTIVWDSADLEPAMKELKDKIRNTLPSEARMTDD